MSTEAIDEVKEEVRLIDKALTQVTAQMGTLVAVVTKLETTSENMAEAIQLIARKEVTVENHSKILDGHDTRIKVLEEESKKFNKVVYESCDIKSKEIVNGDKAVKEELEPKIEKVESNSRWYAGVVATALILAFSYLYQDDSKTESAVFKKLDEISKTVNETAKQVAINSLNTSHNREMLEESKHNHSKGNK